MELALLLVLVVLVELVITVYLVGRVRDYLRRVRMLEHSVEVLMDDAEDRDRRVASSSAALDDAAIYAAVPSATADDIAQAKAILAQLGIGQD